MVVERELAFLRDKIPSCLPHKKPSAMNSYTYKQQQTDSTGCISDYVYVTISEELINLRRNGESGHRSNWN